jgi:hypothetical protein
VSTTLILAQASKEQTCMGLPDFDTESANHLPLRPIPKVQ